VHVRISSPPTTHPCYYGIDTPTRSELIASSHSVDEIARYLTCDSLGYLSVDGLMEAVGAPKSQVGYCAACFTGEYPVAFEQPSGKLIRLRTSGTGGSERPENA
jgi:amidophosphoribosyltransferase